MTFASLPLVSDAVAPSDPVEGGRDLLQGPLPPLGRDSPIFPEENALGCAQGTHGRHTVELGRLEVGVS